MFKKIQKYAQYVAPTAILSLGLSSQAFAAAWDGYEDISAAIGAEFTAALAVVAALLAVTIGVPLGVRLLRRIVK